MFFETGVYFVTDPRMCAGNGLGLIETVLAAYRGGIRFIQLRDKHASSRDFFEITLALAQALPNDAHLIINDRVDVFLAAQHSGANVAGVHIGQDDLPPEVVRSLIGPDAILGLSVGNEAEVHAANSLGGVLNYIGCGVLRQTATKTDAPPALGLSGLSALNDLSFHPVVAIGGIKTSDITSLKALGIAGAAIVSEICLATDVSAKAKELTGLWVDRS